MVVTISLSDVLEKQVVEIANKQNREIESTIIDAIRYFVEKSEKYESLVIDEYCKGNLTIRQASKLLDLNYGQFMELLGARGMSFCNVPEEEAENELVLLNQILDHNK